MLERDPEKLNDRKLGDLWEDWDGNLDAIEAAISGPKSRFLAFSALGLIVTVGALALLYFMIYPRLVTFGEIEAVSVEAVFLAFAAMLVLCFFAVLGASTILRIRPLGSVALTSLPLVRPFAFTAGRLFGVSEDRMSASYITVHNALTRASGAPKSAGEILVLLPRCLSKESMKEAKAVAGEFGCTAAVAGGGSVARKLIAQHKPKAIIALACERDLLSGLKFVGTKAETFALPNKRPSGPCKDTRFDSAALREMIEFFAGPKKSAQ